jgi:hypothetical protein
MTMERETFKHAKSVDRMTAIVNTAQNMIDHAVSDPTFFMVLSELLFKKGYHLMLVQRVSAGGALKLEKAEPTEEK